ncbi:MAG: BatA domain-containing protein [Gemmatirosa sp.]
MTLLAPWGLAAGVAVAAALVALHAITIGRPRPSWLPTARFAPERAPRAVRRLSRPRDRRLLALRVLAALLAGLALARPVRTPPRVAVTRLIVADRSRAADANAIAGAVRRIARPGDVVLPFDAAPGALLTWPADLDSAAWSRALDSALVVRDRRGALSAALVAARRAAPALAVGADSLALVIVSPLVRETVDAATLAVRATWSGRAQVTRARRAGDTTVAPRARRRAAVREAPRDDALLAALALAGVAREDTAPVRVVRARATDADRAWASAAGRVLVEWPADGAPTGARAVTADSAYGLVVGDRAVVAPFVRAALPDPTNARTVAWWADARPAAVERAQGDGCVRSVAVVVPQVGDVALGDAFRALLPALLAPCGDARDLAPLPVGDAARLAGVGPLLAAAPLRATPGGPRDVLGAARLAAAAALLLLELPLRRVLRRDADVTDALDASVPEARAA